MVLWFLVFSALWSSGKRVDLLLVARATFSARRVTTSRQVCGTYMSLLALINVGVLLNYVFVNVSPVKGVLK